MEANQLYIITPPHKPPRRVPADAISVEWLTERLEQIPTVPSSVARRDDWRLPRAVPRLAAPVSGRGGRGRAPALCWILAGSPPLTTYFTTVGAHPIFAVPEKSVVAKHARDQEEASPATTRAAMPYQLYAPIWFRWHGDPTIELH